MNMNDYLLSRWFDVSKYPNVVVADDCVTFPIFNASGQYVGYQVCTPDQPKHEVGDPKLQKYFSWVTKPCASKNAELAVWGLETVHWADKVLFLTEGVFDASRLHWHGLPAVAVMSNNPVHLTSWLKAMPSKKVACVQGDSAGRRLAKFGDECVMLPEGQDVGSLTDEQFNEQFGKWLTK